MKGTGLQNEWWKIRFNPWGVGTKTRMGPEEVGR